MSSQTLKVKRSMSVMWIATAVALLLAARTMPSMSAPDDAGMSAEAAKAAVVASVEAAEIDTGDAR